jgi:hypothetical protein
VLYAITTSTSPINTSMFKFKSKENSNLIAVAKFFSYSSISSNLSKLVELGVLGDFLTSDLHYIESHKFSALQKKFPVSVILHFEPFERDLFDRSLFKFRETQSEGLNINKVQLLSAEFIFFSVKEVKGKKLAFLCTGSTFNTRTVTIWVYYI